MYRIGVDLGGTNIAVGLVDESHSIILKKSLPTNAHREAEKIADDIAKLCLEVATEAATSISDISMIGIASPGIANGDTGEIVYASNLPFRHFKIADYISSKTGVKNIKVANDANAAALGEAVAGAAKDTHNSVMITLGTGVGGGIIINDTIFSGSNHAGAEIGHTVIQKDGVPCPCGRHGCWESYSSATALKRMTIEKIEECKRTKRKTLMSDAKSITGRTACDAMRAGDEAATEVYNEYLSYLAVGIANMINIFQPEVISLGGGVSNEGQSLIDDLLPLIKEQEYGRGIIKSADIRIASLGNDAGIIGAAAL